MERQNVQPENNRITFDISKRTGTEGYVGMLFQLYLSMGNLITDNSFNESSHRLEMLTHFIISLVPDADRRAKIRTDLREKIHEALKPCTTNDDKVFARNMACIEIIGLVIDYTDEHVGVSDLNKLGVDV